MLKEQQDEIKFEKKMTDQEKRPFFVISSRCIELSEGNLRRWEMWELTSG